MRGSARRTSVAAHGRGRRLGGRAYRLRTLTSGPGCLEEALVRRRYRGGGRRSLGAAGGTGEEGGRMPHHLDQSTRARTGHAARGTRPLPWLVVVGACGARPEQWGSQGLGQMASPPGPVGRVRGEPAAARTAVVDPGVVRDDLLVVCCQVAARKVVHRAVATGTALASVGELSTQLLCQDGAPAIGVDVLLEGRIALETFVSVQEELKCGRGHVSADGRKVKGRAPAARCQRPGPWADHFHAARQNCFAARCVLDHASEAPVACEVSGALGVCTEHSVHGWVAHVLAAHNAGAVECGRRHAWIGEPCTPLRAVVSLSWRWRRRAAVRSSRRGPCP